MLIYYLVALHVYIRLWVPNAIQWLKWPWPVETFIIRYLRVSESLLSTYFFHYYNRINTHSPRIRYIRHVLILQFESVEVIFINLWNNTSCLNSGAKAPFVYLHLFYPHEWAVPCSTKDWYIVYCLWSNDSVLLILENSFIPIPLTYLLVARVGRV